MTQFVLNGFVVLNMIVTKIELNIHVIVSCLQAYQFNGLFAFAKVLFCFPKERRQNNPRIKVSVIKLCKVHILRCFYNVNNVVFVHLTVNDVSNGHTLLLQIKNIQCMRYDVQVHFFSK